MISAEEAKNVFEHNYPNLNWSTMFEYKDYYVFSGYNPTHIKNGQNVFYAIDKDSGEVAGIVNPLLDPDTFFKAMREGIKNGV